MSFPWIDIADFFLGAVGFPVISVQYLNFQVNLFLQTACEISTRKSNLIGT